MSDPGARVLINDPHDQIRKGRVVEIVGLKFIVLRSRRKNDTQKAIWITPWVPEVGDEV